MAVVRIRLLDFDMAPIIRLVFLQGYNGDTLPSSIFGCDLIARYEYNKNSDVSCGGGKYLHSPRVGQK